MNKILYGPADQMKQHSILKDNQQEVKHVGTNYKNMFIKKQ